MSDRAAASLRQLLDIMVRLRSPVDGCPWDQAQDFASIAPYTVEEAYEVADSIAAGPEMPFLLDELGDLLFQVVFHARMAEEAGAFDFADVAKAISAKMLRRHPHIFGDAAGTAPPAWDTLKADERAARDETGVLSGLPVGLPALTLALKLTRRAARVGFDWPDADSVLAKLDEEVAELRAEFPAAEPERLADEVGDMLFVVANLARKLGLDPESCLQAANRKFTRRFEQVEGRLAAHGETPGDATLEAMEAEWQRVKACE